MVDDVDAVVAYLAEHDVQCSKPSTIAGVCAQAFTHDPSGNLIEFNQRLL
jgi:catechol 2,3-dioxygenase-like lactoylglutathione lyase family enzyme